MPTCLVIQHVAPESPYVIGEALSAAGVEIQLRGVQDGDELPVSLAGFDGLVLMGGPMSAADDAGFPSRQREIGLIAEALEHSVPTLGVCLGAQLLAAAAGATVMPGSVGPEIGWGSVSLSDAAATDELLADLPAELTVLHWHGDTFELPIGAVHLASNDRYENQAFRLGSAAWGLQFHAEVTATAVEGFVSTFGDELESAGVSAEEILDRTPAALQELNLAQSLICSRFARLVTASLKLAT